MGIWYFWDEYLMALDNFSKREVQRGSRNGESVLVGGSPVDGDSSLLGRETKDLALLDRQRAIVSRFFSAIKRMPKAWNARPWTSQEMTRAGNAVSNDLFRRKMRREADLGPR
jgi:hypothetical protein